MASPQAERFELLLEMSLLLSSKLERAELLRTVLELSSRVVDAESASLLLLDDVKGELYFDTALGLGAEAQKMRLTLGQGIAGTVALRRKSEIVNDVRAEKRWSPAMDDLTGFKTRSILCVPIMVKGRLLGVIEAINGQRGPFTAEDTNLLEAFASQAAVAIDNAHLFANLKEERAKLAAMFSQMHDASVLTDSFGEISLANGAARLLLGHGLTNFTEAFPGMAVIPPLGELLASDKSTVDFIAVRREPTLFVATGRATRTTMENGEGWLFMFRDDTEEWRQEHLKRTFLSLISHKLKTPLSSVIGFSELLLAPASAGNLDAKQVQALRTIHDEGAKVAELVDKLLRYTVLEGAGTTPKFENVSLDEAVGQALKFLQPRINARKARVDFAPSTLTVWADRDMLVEIVKNLVDNAIKFDKTPEPAVALRVRADGRWAALSVTDLGPGIPPEFQQAVFSRFHQVEKDFTGQVEGMGLGLPYVKKVVDLHGGAVRLRSKLGEGTTVTVSLPREPA